MEVLISHADGPRAGGADRGGERSGAHLPPELLPTARWSGDTVGEGGVALEDPRWAHALERAEVVFGIPGSSGEGLVDLVRRAPRLEWVQARNAGAGEQLGAGAAARGDELDGSR